MRSLLLQIVAVTTINLKSISQRLWLSLSTVVAVVGSTKPTISSS